MLNFGNENKKMYQTTTEPKYRISDVQGLTSSKKEDEENEDINSISSEFSSESHNSYEDEQQKLNNRANLLYDHEDNERIADSGFDYNEPLQSEIRLDYNPQEEIKQVERTKQSGMKQATNVQKEQPKQSAEKSVSYVQTQPSQKTDKIQEPIKEESSSDEYDYYAPGVGNDIKRAVKNVTYNAGKIAKQIPEEFNDSYGNFARKYTTLLGIETGYGKLAKSAAEKLSGKETAENLDMAMSDRYLDTPYARQHTIYNSYKDLPSFLIKPMESKIVTQLGKSYLKNTGGILFANDKEASINLAKSEDIKNYIKQNKNIIKDYGIIPKDSIQFKDKNWYNAIGKADIVDLYRNKDGEITMYIMDTYDFNKVSQNPYVQAARISQESGRIKPYFMIYSVKLDKKTSDEYLR